MARLGCPMIFQTKSLSVLSEAALTRSLAIAMVVAVLWTCVIWAVAIP